MQRGASPETRLSNFIGRGEELAELQRLASGCRLLTLVGPGGCGKTRLGMEFAGRQGSRFPDGVIVAELTAVRSPGEFGDAIARAAGLGSQTSDPMTLLIRHWRESRLLLLADNCEHLTDAVAEAVTRLLSSCPELTVLATSRERLNVDGETVWRVPPMSMPDSDTPVSDAQGPDAVRLFVERARNARPGFELNERNQRSVAHIVRRLDGMPLAIELAAARITTLSPTEINARLNDRFHFLTSGPRNVDHRHRTLRATLDWSYDLLAPVDRLLLQRLAVFAGAVRIDAVQDVCSVAPLDAGATLDALQRLVDTSMVEAETDADEQTHYRLLETVRTYAAEKLASSGEEDTLRAQHLAFYRRLARDAYQTRLHAGASVEHQRLWDEMADVRSALEWAARDPLVELELFGNLKLIWLIYAPGEGLRRFTTIIREVPANPTTTHLRALEAGLSIWGRSGHPGRPLTTPDEFIALGRSLGDDLAVALGYLGTAYVAERVEGDLAKTRDHLRLAVAELERLGDRCTLAMALASVGAVEMQLGNLDAARPWVERGLQLARDAEDEHGMAGAYYTLGWLDLLRGDDSGARASFIAALALAGEGNLLSVSDQLQGLAAIDAERHPRAALRFFAVAHRIRDELEARQAPPWAQLVGRRITTARAALPADIADAAWQAGAALPVGQAIAIARDEQLRLTDELEPVRTPLPSPVQPSTATLTLEGEYWTVDFDGRTSRLRDSKGLRVLATLLGAPGRPFPALHLERLGATGDEATARSVAAGDAGELLDAAARDAYRARVAELRERITEAEGMGKADAAGAMREELEYIVRELSRALGIGGRSRRAGSVAERARINVTRAVKAAIQRIRDADAALGAHLDATVHTGVVSVYTPDPRVPVGWHVSGSSTTPG